MKKLLKEQAPGKQKFSGLGPEATWVSELPCTRVSVPEPPGGSGPLALDTARGGCGGRHQLPSPAGAPRHEHPGLHPSHEASERGWPSARSPGHQRGSAAGLPALHPGRPLVSTPGLMGPRTPLTAADHSQAATGPGATRTLGGGS